MTARQNEVIILDELQNLCPQSCCLGILSFPAVLVFASTVAGPPYPTIQFLQAVLLARLAHLMALALFRGDISENLDVPEPELLTISSWIWL